MFFVLNKACELSKIRILSKNSVFTYFCKACYAKPLFAFNYKTMGGHTLKVY